MEFASCRHNKVLARAALHRLRGGYTTAFGETRTATVAMSTPSRMSQLKPEAYAPKHCSEGQTSVGPIVEDGLLESIRNCQVSTDMHAQMGPLRRGMEETGKFRPLRWLNVNF